MLAATRVNPWAWHAHPDVWALFGVIAGLYWFALRRIGPRVDRGGEPVATRRQVGCFSFGLTLLWLGADWPVHDIAERYLLSVHMFQHLLFTLAAPGLLIVGIPPWLQRRLWGSGRRAAVLRRIGRPLLAGLVFNAFFLFSHWPLIVNAVLRSEPLHFSMHVALFSLACVMWFPVLNRQPGLPQMTYPGRMIYLFLQSVLPTVPASFLTLSTTPLYRFYQTVARPFPLSAIDDQQLAGAIMKVYGGFLLWMVIFVMFFRWYGLESRDDPKVLTWDEVRRELDATRAPIEG